MRVIGFNFTKIAAEKSGVTSRPVDTKLEFTNVEQQEIDIIKDGSALKCSFSYQTKFNRSNSSEKDKPTGSFHVEGDILITGEKEEVDEIQKSWKDKKLPLAYRDPLLNLILKRATPKAVELCDIVALPSPVPIPQLKPQEKQKDA